MRSLTSKTTYHKDKLYVPREIKEKMGLTDGDKLKIEVVGKDEARISVVRRKSATERLIEWLENPPIKGRLKETLSRRDIYEDAP
jgi:bifunctional DNA-binding transcriptional regulator/antitoxin component of YhaV-PrlF toxin-antitoxin module